MLLPAAAGHLSLLLEAQLSDLATEASDLIGEFTQAIRELESVNLAENQPHDDLLAHARYMHDQVVTAMEAVRAVADRLERIVADDLWPLPKYAEILFIK
jgi:glutamine synthetase